MFHSSFTAQGFNDCTDEGSPGSRRAKSPACIRGSRSTSYSKESMSGKPPCDLIIGVGHTIHENQNDTTVVGNSCVPVTARLLKICLIKIGRRHYS